MYINCTPHAILVYDRNDCQVVKRSMCSGLEPLPGSLPVRILESTTVARVGQQCVLVEIHDGIAVYRREFTTITGLPDPVPGTLYIVSSLVLAASNRQDLVAPNEFVRDTNGNVIGCCSFTR